MTSIRHRESVCRSLFGPVDHEQLRRDLTQKLREMTEQDSRRWNFNFQAETPLPGRFQWEEISANCAATLYQERAQLRDAEEDDGRHGDDDDDDRLRDSEESAGTDQENCPSIFNTNKRPAEVTPVRRKRSLSKPAAKTRTNTRITDFFAKRRRTTETKSVLNQIHTNETALCKTIR